MKESHRTKIGNWQGRCRDLEKDLNSLKKFKEEKDLHEKEITELYLQIEKEFQRQRSDFAELHSKQLQEKDESYGKIEFEHKKLSRDQAQKDLAYTQDNHERLVEELLGDRKTQKEHIDKMKKAEERLHVENRTLTRNMEFTQQHFEEVNKTKIVLSKKLKQYEEEMKVQKESLTQVVKEFEKEKELMKHHYEQEISKRSHDNLTLIEQLKVKNKEFSHVKGLSQMILDQRSEVETFFLEALEQIKHEHRKKLDQERREAGSNNTANRETREKQRYDIQKTYYWQSISLLIL
eukprot:TRINITY_DN6084_c0_g3_i1.p1 TRINITY_DN6084_c0_g3~~TRINITY_DN6084_c0_g3_i1.p1  ORF type:complete len:292 (-),score=57.82 TRINITY_DN6084_c0_g3_i1:257-1132(-)